MKSDKANNNYRKAFNFRVRRGSYLDRVLQYLDAKQKPLVNAVEELLLAVYLIPAMEEDGEVEHDVYRQGVINMGFLAGILESLRFSVDLVRPEKCRPAFDNNGGMDSGIGRDTSSRRTNGDKSEALGKNESNDGADSEDYRDKAISGAQETRSMFNIS
ncbi:MAG: hypothetical protein HC795_06510 [Coleofasciculaceae cyanobacterium RL_1_1]|nr:hypothetical protein [Coleofasciculaceae cyanobacterium RL_1_1]